MNDLQRNHQLQGLDKKTKRRKPEGLRQFRFYIFSIPPREGQMCHVPGLYLPNKTNSLRQKGDAQGLDKFSGGKFGGGRTKVEETEADVRVKRRRPGRH
jgi:hypothetical protein